MMVKICGMTNREDAEAAVDAGASAIGFVFYPKSPRFVTMDQARAIAAGLPVLKVGIFVNGTPDETAGYDFLDILQLHGDEPAQDMALYSKPVWKAFRVQQGWNPAVLEQYPVNAFLLDGPTPGSGQSFDWNIAKGLIQRFVLAGGLDDTNVADAIRQVRPWGVDAVSRLESSPGRKDREKMKRFIQAAHSVTL